MAAERIEMRRPIAGLSIDFWIFWAGQVVSTLGSSFTLFAMPLLVFRLTGSAVNLSLSTAAAYLPYILFGLLIGAWTDRLDRKRVILAANVLFAISVALVPVAAASGHLTVWLIYAVQFVNATLRLFFTAAVFSAIPGLVPRDRLVAANGRMQASYSAMSVVGPLLVGGLAAFLPLPALLLVDAASYLLSAGALMFVRGSFNPPATGAPARQSMRGDVMEGLRFLFGHPVLRSVSIMMALVNFVAMTVGAQLVYFAKVQFNASATQVGILFAFNAVGVFVLTLVAGPLRRHWPFSRVALGLLEIQGVAIIVIAQIHSFWAVLPWIALWQGLGALFTVNTTSLRQEVTPQHLLGRVVTTAGVLGGSVIPLGTLAGGFAIQRTGNISLVFTVIGVLVFAIPVIFSFTALGHAERYLPGHEEVTPETHLGTEALERWLEEASHARTESTPLDLEGWSQEELVRLRAGLARFYLSSQRTQRILEDMLQRPPNAASLQQALSELTSSMEDATSHWREIAARLRETDVSESGAEAPQRGEKHGCGDTPGPLTRSRSGGPPRVR